MLNQSSISGCYLLVQAFDAGLQRQDPDFLNLRKLGLQALLVCLQCTARQSLDQEDGASAEQFCPDGQPELQASGSVKAGLQRQDYDFLNLRLRALLGCFQRTARQNPTWGRWCS